MAAPRKYGEKGKIVSLYSSCSPDFENLLKIGNTVVLYRDTCKGEEGNYDIARYKKGEIIHGIVSNEYGWKRTALGVRKIESYSVHYSSSRDELVGMVKLSSDIFLYRREKK